MDKENGDKNVTIRVSNTLLVKFRETCNLNYKTMSEAIRDMMREYIKTKTTMETK
jgi:metal-responsive CopG/Arc/MetJ family transcriptional regulator